MATKALARDQVRESLLDAMDSLLIRFGYQKTTVDDLASEAGIGKGTVYLYFDSKEQVALSCIDRLHERLIAKMLDASETNDAALTKLENMLYVRVKTRFDYCSNASCLDEMLAALHKELVIRKVQYHADEARILEDVLARAIQSGELPDCDAAAVSESMILATNSFLPYSMRTSQLGSSEELEVKVRRIARLFVLGLAGLPAPVPTH